MRRSTFGSLVASAGIVILAIAGAVVLVIAWAGSRDTSRFNRISRGLTYLQVLSIMGRESDHSGWQDAKIVVGHWVNEDETRRLFVEFDPKTGCVTSTEMFDNTKRPVFPRTTERVSILDRVFWLLGL